MPTRSFLFFAPLRSPSSIRFEGDTQDHARLLPMHLTIFLQIHSRAQHAIGRSVSAVTLGHARHVHAKCDRRHCTHGCNRFVSTSSNFTERPPGAQLRWSEGCAVLPGTLRPTAAHLAQHPGPNETPARAPHHILCAQHATASRKVDRRDDPGRVHAPLLTRTEEGQGGRHPVPQAGRRRVPAEEGDAVRGTEDYGAERGGGSVVHEERIAEPILEHIVTDALVEVAQTTPQERIVVDAPMPQAGQSHRSRSRLLKWST